MKRFRRILCPGTLVAAGVLIIGCGRKEGDGHDHGRNAGHGHEEGSPSGASFKTGKGVMVTQETRQILDLEVMEVSERRLPSQIHFTVQVFGEKHRHLPNPEDHSDCDVYGAGFVSTNATAMVKAGQRVELLTSTNAPLHGVVLAVQRALALGESEIVIGMSNSMPALKPGEFVPACISLPREETVMAIPQTALLRTSEGAFVYAVNGGAYFRTAVKVGAEAGGWIEITDGLLAGDQVVTKAVQTLWLIELRATKGGGHAH